MGKLDGKVETENPSLTEFISGRVSRLRRVSLLTLHLYGISAPIVPQWQQEQPNYTNKNKYTDLEFCMKVNADLYIQPVL
jgi:hypothetical protein